MARQKAHHRVQPPAQPFLQRIRVPVVPVFRNGEALRAAARRPRHHVGSHDVPPAGRRARQQPDQKLPAERIPRTARFRVVPLRLPDLAGRRHQNGDRGAPPRQGLLLGIALLAAQRLLAGSFVVEPRLVRRLEGAALLRPLRIRRHTDLPDPRRRTTRHLRRFRPAHSGERHLVRPGGASDGRPDRGIRTADRRPGQRQHESRRHRHADAAERSRSGGGRHSGDIHRCGEDIPQQLLPRTAENDELPESNPALQGRPGRRGVRRHRPVGQPRAGRLSVGRRRNGALLRQLLRPHAGRNAHRPRGVGTERQGACAAPEINVAGRHLFTPKNRYP